ncbi:Uma2 family endonuclease [Streptomyces smaragdinus]|nr:Uma2 family endonuclease [Streptomyces smaragdinus]
MSVRKPQYMQMHVEEFEQLADAAPESVRLEFINGRIGVKAVPDGDHDSIVIWLAKRCMRARPELDMYLERGLAVEGYRTGRARPDSVLVPEAHFAGNGEWSDPEGVLMAVEVTSHDRDSHQRDCREKPVAYAEVGIPVYLLIDRRSGTISVYRNPGEDRYRDVHTVSFGERIVLPEPVNIELDTTVLKNYVS